MPALRCVVGIWHRRRLQCWILVRKCIRIQRRCLWIILFFVIMAASLSSGLKGRIVWISQCWPHIACSCYQDMLSSSSSSCSALGLNGICILTRSGAARRRHVFELVTGCCQGLYEGKIERAGFPTVMTLSHCFFFSVCSPAYIRQLWCNMAKENRLTIDMLALWTLCESTLWQQTSTLEFSF